MSAHSNQRGNSVDRARRRAWLLSPAAGFGGNGVEVPCALGTGSLSRVCEGTVTDRTMNVDRIVCGVNGGRYVRGNIRPTCEPCNLGRGARW